MALTEAQKDAILELIAGTFEGNVNLFQSWLQRSKLETEAAALQSAIRKKQAERDAGLDQAEAAIQNLQANYQAKLEEIDAL
jgi:hypothetical protein